MSEYTSSISDSSWSSSSSIIEVITGATACLFACYAVPLRLLKKIEEARRQHQQYSSSGQEGGSGGGDTHNDPLPLMGTVRAAHVVAGAGVDDTLPLPLQKSTLSDPLDKPKYIWVGKTVEKESYNGPRTVVYDPDDEVSRFHPQYELLVEACAHYIEVSGGL